MPVKKSVDPHPLDDLLATKLEVPLVGACVVPRHRLTNVIKTGMERRLTLLTAPTGYGKTTLLAEWLSHMRMPDWRIVWVTVDSYDNEPFRLWSYIAAALQKVYPRLHNDPQRWFHDQAEGSRFAAFTPLINTITQIPYQLVLVLDDYQWITSESIHKEIRYLLDHQPKNLHLLISSRVTPPFPLSRLRAQRQLVEITAKDLSFTLQEAKKYFSSVMEIDIDQDQATALHVATEGWIAGLQLATLSLQGQPDRRSFIANLPDKDHQIFDYLTEEVLDRLDLDLRDFLLKTSILSEFSAPLCDAILERDDSREVLNRVQQANLFIVSRDEHQHWYSYHRLFADTLQHYLKDTYPEIIPDLHRKSCLWLQENGYPDKAVIHALACGELEHAARIIDACAMQAVLRFDMVQLSQWISRFSDDLIAKRPQLGIYLVLANCELEQFDKVEPKLRALERTLDKSVKNGLRIEDEKLVRWEIAAVQASVTCRRGNYDESISAITALIQDPPPGDVYFSGFLIHSLAEGYALRGDLEAAVEAYAKGCRFAIEHGLLKEYCYSRSELAFVRKMQGRLRDAEYEYQDLFDYVLEQAFPCDMLAFARTSLAEVALEQNRLEQASEHISWVLENYDRIEACPPNWLRLEWLFTHLVKYFLAQHDIQNALIYYEKAMRGFRANRQVIHYLSSQLIDMQVTIWSATGKLSSKSLNFQQQIAFLNPTGKSNPAVHTAFARYYLAQSEPGDALRVLDECIPVLQSAGMQERLLEALVLKSLAWRASANQLQAVQSLHQALKTAVTESYRRVFTDEGVSMKDLLEQYLQQPISEDKSVQKILHAYASSLLSEMEQPAMHPSIPPSETQSTENLVYPLFEPLSHRELEILRLMVEGKSTKEIAAALMVSINTAKVHIRSVYRKTGVHARPALLKRARELGIINSL